LKRKNNRNPHHHTEKHTKSSNKSTEESQNNKSIKSKMAEVIAEEVAVEATVLAVEAAVEEAVTVSVEGAVLTFVSDAILAASSEGLESIGIFLTEGEVDRTAISAAAAEIAESMATVLQDVNVAQMVADYLLDPWTYEEITGAAMDYQAAQAALRTNIWSNILQRLAGIAASAGLTPTAFMASRNFDPEAFHSDRGDDLHANISNIVLKRAMESTMDPYVQEGLTDCLNRAEKEAKRYLHHRGNHIKKIALIPVYGAVKAGIELSHLKHDTMKHFHSVASSNVVSFLHTEESRRKWAETFEAEADNYLASDEGNEFINEWLHENAPELFDTEDEEPVVDTPELSNNENEEPDVDTGLFENVKSVSLVIPNAVASRSHPNPDLYLAPARGNGYVMTQSTLVLNPSGRRILRDPFLWTIEKSDVGLGYFLKAENSNDKYIADYSVSVSGKPAPRILALTKDSTKALKVLPYRSSDSAHFYLKQVGSPDSVVTLFTAGYVGVLRPFSSENGAPVFQHFKLEGALNLD